MKCTLAYHDRLKRSAVARANCQVIGVQPGYNDDGERDAAFDLTLFNCNGCHSTLAVEEDKTVREMPLDGQFGASL